LVSCIFNQPIIYMIIINKKKALPELLETVALSGGSARRRHMNPEVQANHLNETKALGSVACVFLYSGKRN